MVKNCQFLVLELQFDHLSISKLKYIGCYQCFLGVCIETKSTRENGGSMCIGRRTILMKPKTKMQFIPLMFT